MNNKEGAIVNTFIETMTERAKQCPKKVAFPETGNADILRTAQRTKELGIGFPVLMGNQEAFAKENGIATDGFTYYDYTAEENRLALAEEYTAKHEDFSAKAVARKSKDPLRAALFLLKLHHVDCVAAGKEYSTGDVIFESIAIVVMQEGVESVSRLGIADIPGFDGPQGAMLALADCAITAQPDAKDLAGIAISSADTVSTLLGSESGNARIFYMRKFRTREYRSDPGSDRYCEREQTGHQDRRGVPAGFRDHPAGGRTESEVGKRCGRKSQRPDLPKSSCGKYRREADPDFRARQCVRSGASGICTAGM